MTPTNETSNESTSRPLAVPISLLLISLFSGAFFIFSIYEFPHASNLGGVLLIVILMSCGITCVYSLMLAIRGFRNKQVCEEIYHHDLGPYLARSRSRALSAFSFHAALSSDESNSTSQWTSQYRTNLKCRAHIFRNTASFALYSQEQCFLLALPLNGFLQEEQIKSMRNSVRPWQFFKPENSCDGARIGLGQKCQRVDAPFPM